MEVRQLFDHVSCTYTYLVFDKSTKEAVLVDPVYEFFLRDDALIDELGLNLVATIETHIHADHVTAAWLFKQKRKSQITLSKSSGAVQADRLLVHGDIVSIGSSKLIAISTPGHTNGCMSYVSDSRAFVLTGDALLVRGTGRTDFQEGSSSKLFKSVRDHIFSLPDDCRVYPGHDYNGIMSSTVVEERRFNPRLGGELSESDFISSMENLNLAHPNKIDQAVPANMNCGIVKGDRSLNSVPLWAKLRFTFAGNWDIEATELSNIIKKVSIIDVRSLEEFNGPLGRLPGSIHLPLDIINTDVLASYKDRHVVFVCRAGGRSVQALKNADLFKDSNSASLRGGIIAWRSLGLNVENGSD
jgi:glyoxylase-like metal-dependent hydrolase (beta-lactamase superfamily II)/rhodanese-related sulfurtransferase